MINFYHYRYHIDYRWVNNERNIIFIKQTPWHGTTETMAEETEKLNAKNTKQTRQIRKKGLCCIVQDK